MADGSLPIVSTSCTYASVVNVGNRWNHRRAVQHLAAPMDLTAVPLVTTRVFADSFTQLYMSKAMAGLLHLLGSLLQFQTTCRTPALSLDSQTSPQAPSTCRVALFRKCSSSPLPNTIAEMFTGFSAELVMMWQWQSCRTHCLAPTLGNAEDVIATFSRAAVT